MFKASTDTQDVPTTERFIELVLQRVKRCDIHPSPSDIDLYPCYVLPISITKGSDRATNWGVCNRRAEKAGFILPREEPKIKLNTRWNRS